MSKDLLIYTTVANRADNIKYSVLIDPEKKKAVMPSVVVLHNETEVYYSDNNLFILNELLPALKAYQSRKMNEGQEELVNGFIESVNEPINDAITELIDILEYAIANNLLTETM